MIRERNVILGLLIGLAAACWALLAWQARGADMAMAMSATMGMAAPLFLGVWIVMMAAMMFPTAAPMILMFHQVQSSHRRNGNAFVPTWIFVGGYMAVWTPAGVVAYGAALAGEWFSAWVGWSSYSIARAGGLLLILAGIYQLTPLKTLCLTRCRSPLSFIMTSWRSGNGGAFRMGLEHGLYCLGCCWLLFVILFPLGMMNIAAMALLTALIFAEKTMPWGRWAARGAALGLAVVGAAVIYEPELMPGFMAM